MNINEAKLQKVILALILVMFVAVAAVIAYKIQNNKSDFEKDRRTIMQNQGAETNSDDAKNDKTDELQPMQQTNDANADLDQVIKDLENTNWTEDLEDIKIDELTQ